MRIKAAVLPAPAHAVEVRDVDLAEPKAGEVLVRMGGSGVCGSDLNVVDGRRQLVPYPAVLGHEAAGVVETVGPGVQRFSRGDHVVLTILPSCGHCLNCLIRPVEPLHRRSRRDARREPARRVESTSGR